jgi:hypothetical protein
LITKITGPKESVNADATAQENIDMDAQHAQIQRVELAQIVELPNVTYITSIKR